MDLFKVKLIRQHTTYSWCVEVMEDTATYKAGEFLIVHTLLLQNNAPDDAIYPGAMIQIVFRKYMYFMTEKPTVFQVLVYKFRQTFSWWLTVEIIVWLLAFLVIVALVNIQAGKITI